MDTRENRRKRRRRQAMMKMWASVAAMLIVVILIVVIIIKAVSCESKDTDSTGGNAAESSQAQSALKDDNQAGEGGTEATEAETEVIEYPQIIKDAQITEYGSVVEVDGAGYELYTYKEKTASNYASAVTSLADSLEGTAKVYDVVIPLSSQITFPDNLLSQITSSDQKTAIDDIYGFMGDNVLKVNAYEQLMQHRDEYIYFRTDHHWTALGAYYAYTALCDSMEIEPKELETYQTKQFDGFLGSFYNDTSSDTMKNNPDTVIAYEPDSEAVCHVTTSDGTKYDWPVIYDVTSYKAGLKYSTFIAADNPVTDIENKSKQDNSSCVVVKESFGNAFVPFLVDNYNHVYVIDYRYWQGNVADYVRQVGASEVILLNNVSMIRNQYLVGQLTAVIQ